MSFIGELRSALGMSNQENTYHLSDTKHQYPYSSSDGSGWADRLVGVPSQRRNDFSGGLENDKAVKSLRTGEDYYAPDERSRSDRRFVAGIGDARYLGNGIGDVVSSDYFSDKDISDAVASQTFVIKDPSKRVDGNPKGPFLPIGKFTVLYDEDGAIAGIDTDYMNWNDSTQYGKENGDTYEQSKKIRGAASVASFFKDLGIASDDSDFYVELKDKDNPDAIGRSWRVGSKDGVVGGWIPTKVFGSKGIFNYPSEKNQWRDSWNAWNNVGFGINKGSGKKAWEEYWSQ